MVGSTDAVNDSDAVKSTSSSVSCSICLDLVYDNGERSTVKLQCGHEFHLDCIGSAFNMKGAMQCPNCRKVEGGRWLFANGSVCAISDIGGEDWMPNEDPHELSYSGMPFGVHWCPFSGLTVRSSFEEVESSSTTFANLQGNRVMLTEHTAAPSLAPSYIAYFRPIPPPGSSNFTESINDPNFRHRWNAQSGHSEIYAPRTSTNIHYQRWDCHFPTFSANRSHIDRGDQASVHPARLRSTRAESDAAARSGSFVHPFHQNQGNPQSHERIQVSHSSHHQQQPNNIMGIPSSITPGFRRFSVARGLPLIVPAVSQPDRSGDFYIFPPSDLLGQNVHEAENSLLNHQGYAWERDQPSRFPVVSLNRPGSFCPRHWS